MEYWINQITDSESETLNNFINKINSEDKTEQSFLAVIGSKVKTLKFILDLQEHINPDDCEIVSVDSINSMDKITNLVTKFSQDHKNIKCLMIETDSEDKLPTSIVKNLVAEDKIFIQRINDIHTSKSAPNIVITFESDDYINSEIGIKYRSKNIYLN